MMASARHLTATVVMGGVFTLALAIGAEAHAVKPDKPEARQKPAVVQQEPRKRQNFRARRADEFPPWEGFEDCPLAFPCVGIIVPRHRRH